MDIQRKFSLSSRVRFALSAEGTRVLSEVVGKPFDRSQFYLSTIGEIMRMFGPYISKEDEAPKFFDALLLIADIEPVHIKVVGIGTEKRFAVCDNVSVPFLDGDDIIAVHLGRQRSEILVTRNGSHFDTIRASARNDGRTLDTAFVSDGPMLDGVVHYGQINAHDFEEGDELTFEFEGGQKCWQHRVADRIQKR